MTFVPASSVASGVVTGTVAVSNLPADQLVHFTTPIDVDVLNFPALQAVTQGTDPWVVDGSGVTQPVSVDALPLPDGAATDDTLSEVALTAILQREKLEVE